LHAAATPLDPAHALAELVAPGASERDRLRRLSWDELDRFSESGLGAITVPRELSGADVSLATLAEVFVILCAADPAFERTPQNHFGILNVLLEISTLEQKRRFYGDVMAGG
jgi:alkylation response protein AidB-like acyl-CoA dehydrogenase